MKKIILLSSLLALTSIVNAGLYRWIDETGKVHYSDKMPIAASKKTHTQLAGNGLVRKTIDPEATIKLAVKTRQEKDLRKQERLQEKRKALLKEIETAKNNKRDKFLLSTYENEGEIVDFFEKKIKLLEGSNSSFTARSLFLQLKVRKLETQRLTAGSEAILESLNKNIIRMRKKLKRYSQALDENSRELMKITSNYKNDYNRFTELNKK